MAVQAHGQKTCSGKIREQPARDDRCRELSYVWPIPGPSEQICFILHTLTETLFSCSARHINQNNNHQIFRDQGIQEWEYRPYQCAVLSSHPAPEFYLLQLAPRWAIITPL
jgi:hypothetical protein